MLFILHAAKDVHIALLFLRQCGILEYEDVWCPGRGECLVCGQVLLDEKLANGRHQWELVSISVFDVQHMEHPEGTTEAHVWKPYSSIDTC